jgi:HEAT repeat protein
VNYRLFWTYRFEHEKERILADRIAAARRRAGRPKAEVLSGKVLPLLRAAAKHESAWVRDAAVLALGKIGGEAALRYVISRAENDTDFEVRNDALLAVGLCGGPDAVAYLTEKLEVKRWKTPCFAAMGLGLTGDPAAIEPLLAVWKQARKKDRYGWSRTECVALALGALGGEEVASKLAARVGRDQPAGIQIFVCQALGRIGGRAAGAALVKATGSKVGAVSTAAVLQLGRWPERRIGPLLLDERGLDSGRNEVKCAALAALAEWAARLKPTEIRRKTAVDEISAAAESPPKNIYAAMHAALAMGESGLPDSTAYFLGNLDPARLKYRSENHSAMAMALGLLRERKALPVLTKLLESEGLDGDFRGYCAFALGASGDRGSAAVVRLVMEAAPDNADLERSGCWALALVGGEADLPCLFRLLRDDRPAFHEVRGAAAIAIGLIGGPKTLDKLIEIATEDDIASTRAFAIAAIGWMLDRDVVPRLPRMFNGLPPHQASGPVRDALKNL